MKLLNLLLLTLLPFSMVPEMVTAQPDDWQNPGIFERNQTQPHAKIIPYDSVDKALENNLSENPNYLSLDGPWKFLLVEHPRFVPEGFFQPIFNTSDWRNIQVPSNWETEGFGYPKFRNIAMTIATKPPHVPVDHNPTGCYKRIFQLPSNWKDREVFLRFEGVKSASIVWINGKEVGYNEGGFEPAEFNITHLLKAGKNEIAVQVMRYSDGSFLENQDMWRLSGIFRSVALIAKPRVHLQDYYVNTTFDSNYRNAYLNLEVSIQNNSGNQTGNHTLEIDLIDQNAKTIWENPVSKTTGVIENQSHQKVSISIPVTEPLQWSPEKPNRYTLSITLKDPLGKVVECTAPKIGFRQTEIKEGAVWVNGKMVKLNGVNSHMHHPVKGQAVPLETIRKDLELMKQFNINLVRTSHYPASPEYLDLADEIGMYIISEAGTECHDNEYLSEMPEWADLFVDRGRKMIYRDRNHPSVIFWSAGNEAGEGKNLQLLMEEGRKIDPSRPGFMYGGNNFHIPFEDIVGPRYWRPLEIKNLAEGKVTGPDDQRPSFQDEYLAATGNGLGGLDEYWELIWKYPRLTGGAIWDWISPGMTIQVVMTKDDSPLKNNPAIMGRPTFIEGRSGKAIHLSGHDDWVEFYRHPELDIAGDQLTVEFWVKPERNEQPNTFITKGSHQLGIIQPDQENLEFYLQTGSYTNLRVKIPENWYGEWHHISAIYNGEKMLLYIDFEKVGEKAASGKIRNGAYPVCLGRNAELHDQGEFRGRLSACALDDVRIYAEALAIEEIKNQTPERASQKSRASLRFEELWNEGEFFGTGLGGRTYGIIWPDRTIQPEIYQIKKSAQPVLIELVDENSGSLKFTNRHNFTDLKEYNLHWMITDSRNDTLKNEVITGPGCLPGETTTMNLGYERTLFGAENDVWLTVSFVLKESSVWAEKGHEIAWEQFLVTKARKPLTVPVKMMSTPTIDIGDKVISIQGEHFTYVIDKQSGTFTSMKVGDRELIQSGFDFSVWRAPLANDMDPWGSEEFTKNHFTPGLGRSIENQLRTLGMEYPVRQVSGIVAGELNGRNASLNMVIFTGTNGMNSGFEEIRSYIFQPDGTIDLTHKIIPHGEMPMLLPRKGLVFTLPEEFEHVEWYGRGPFETYPDRKTGAKTGIWKSDAASEYVPYLIPQDHGNKSDIRWVSIRNSEGQGFILEATGDLLNFSLHQYSTDHLTRAVYPFQLAKPGFLTLNIDYEVSGVGETARRTLTKYRIFPSAGEYSVRWKPAGF